MKKNTSFRYCDREYLIYVICQNDFLKGTAYKRYACATNVGTIGCNSKVRGCIITFSDLQLMKVVIKSQREAGYSIVLIIDEIDQLLHEQMIQCTHHDKNAKTIAFDLKCKIFQECEMVIALSGTVGGQSQTQLNNLMSNTPVMKAPRRSSSKNSQS